MRDANMADGAAFVLACSLRVGRRHGETVIIVNNRRVGSGFYVILPDPSPEDEANPMFPVQRRCDLENAMLTLEYVAGGGEL